MTTNNPKVKEKNSLQFPLELVLHKFCFYRKITVLNEDVILSYILTLLI